MTESPYQIRRIKWAGTSCLKGHRSHRVFMCHGRQTQGPAKNILIRQLHCRELRSNPGTGFLPPLPDRLLAVGLMQKYCRLRSEPGKHQPLVHIAPRLAHVTPQQGKVNAQKPGIRGYERHESFCQGLERGGTGSTSRCIWKVVQGNPSRERGLIST